MKPAFSLHPLLLLFAASKLWYYNECRLVVTQLYACCWVLCSVSNAGCSCPQVLRSFTLHALVLFCRQWGTFRTDSLFAPSPVLCLLRSLLM